VTCNRISMTRMFSCARSAQRQKGSAEREERKEGGMGGVDGLCFHLF